MASLQRFGMALLRAPANEIAFAMRHVLRWQRGTPPAASSESGRFEWAAPEAIAALRERAADLHAHYSLDALADAKESIYCSNLARLAGLERLAGDLELPVGPDGIVRTADLGVGDFHYAVALQQWLARHGMPESAQRRVVLRGLEVDGYGIYRDGHSRADHAQEWARRASLGNSLVRFEVADATRVRLPEQDVVSLFFPFLTAYACLQWGAPLSRSKPQKLLRAAVGAVRPGGWLVVANQTKAEHRLLCRLMANLPVVRIARRSLRSELVPDAERTHGQVGSIWRKQEDVPSGKRPR